MRRGRSEGGEFETNNDNHMTEITSECRFTIIDLKEQIASMVWLYITLSLLVPENIASLNTSNP